MKPAKLPLVQAFRDFAFEITPKREELEVIQQRLNSTQQAVHKVASNSLKLMESMYRHSGQPGWGLPPFRYRCTGAFGSSQRGTLIRPAVKIDVDLLLAFEGHGAVMAYFDDGQKFLGRSWTC